MTIDTWISFAMLVVCAAIAVTASRMEQGRHRANRPSEQGLDPGRMNGGLR